MFYLSKRALLLRVSSRFVSEVAELPLNGTISIKLRKVLKAVFQKPGTSKAVQMTWTANALSQIYLIHRFNRVTRVKQRQGLSFLQRGDE